MKNLCLLSVRLFLLEMFKASQNTKDTLNWDLFKLDYAVKHLSEIFLT